MSLTQLLNRPCTLITRTYDGTSSDEFGNDVPTEHVTRTVCTLQQTQRAEPAGAGEFSQTLWLAVFPAGTVFSTASALVTDDDGHEYEAVGDPEHVYNEWQQAESHVEATVRRTAGPGQAS